MAVPADYNGNIPQATDLLSLSQDNLLNNFGALKALIDVNHVDFAAAGAGKHFFVEFPIPVSTPMTIAGEVGMYSRTSAITGAPELVLQKQTNGPIYEFSSCGASTTGFASLPSGILYKWGIVTPGSSGRNTITFPVAANIPVFNSTPFALYLTPLRNTTTLPMQVALYWDASSGSVNSATQVTIFISNFSGNAGSANSQISYLAIGIGTGV